MKKIQLIMNRTVFVFLVAGMVYANPSEASLQEEGQGNEQSRVSVQRNPKTPSDADIAEAMTQFTLTKQQQADALRRREGLGFIGHPTDSAQNSSIAGNS